MTLGREPIHCKDRFQQLAQLDRNHQIPEQALLAIDGQYLPLPAGELPDEELDVFLARFQQQSLAKIGKHRCLKSIEKVKTGHRANSYLGWGIRGSYQYDLRFLRGKIVE